MTSSSTIIITDNADADTLPKIEMARETASRTFTPPPFPNIGALFAARAGKTPYKDFLTFLDEDGKPSRYSYAAFFQEARCVAALMSQLGLRTGDRVATLTTNDPRAVLVYFAAWFSGVTVVPINCGEDDSRIQFILGDAEVKTIFVADDQAARCQPWGAALPKLRHVLAFTGEKGLDTRLSATGPLDELPDLSAATEALIVYTSGTTGPPKGVVLEQSNLLADAQAIADWHKFGPNDRAMCILPIHHVNGTVVTLMTPLISGGSIVLNRRFRAHSFWQTLADEQCTWTSVVPTILAFLCEGRADLTQLNLSRFRHIVCGAGPLTVDLAARFDERFSASASSMATAFPRRLVTPVFCRSISTPAALRPLDDGCGFPSIGCRCSANEMAIHDAQGNALAPGVRGEIVARGPNVMKYYFKRPDANRDTFAHGWFRSGDEGFYQVGPDGRDYYFITGRLKELIIRGGVNYSPFDIDEVLSAIPGVKAAMAVGFDNAFYGEEIGAYVQREDSATVTEEEILAACRTRLPYAKSPKVVIFGDTFPVTSTGKYQRIET